MTTALLSGCSTKSQKVSASELVENNLKMIYLNEYSDTYLQQVGLTEEDALAKYENGIDSEVASFASYFNINLDSCEESVEAQINELYRLIYAKSKFEVGEAVEEEDVYTVPVTVYPIDIMQVVVEEDAPAYVEQWQTRAAADEFKDMDPVAFETEWANGIIAMVYSRIETIGYLDPVEIDVRFVKNEETGLYSMNSDDFAAIDEAVIRY